MNGNGSGQPNLDRVGRLALGVGVAALILCALEWRANPTQFFRSYLLGYMLWLAVALGSFGIVMLHHQVNGKWGYLLRRPLEAAAQTVWTLMVWLFIPFFFGLPRLYSWAQPATVAGEALPPFKSAYLSVPFWVGRTIGYFAAWVIFIYLLNRWSWRQDEQGDDDRRWLGKMKKLSAAGLVLYGFTVTFAVVDWIMSLEPQFFSTIYGMIYIVLPALAAMALATIVVRLLARYDPVSNVITPLDFNDFGNLLLVFVMLWAYLSFDQFLIIWAGNLQDEIPWYTSRAAGGWGAVALVLVLFHFAVPFVLLLSRDVKRRMTALSAVAALLLVMTWVDLFWLIVPAFHPAVPSLHWMDIVAPIGIGGLWVWRFTSQLKQRPFLPLHDPRFEGVYGHGE